RMVTRVGERQAIALPQGLIDEFDARARGETRALDVPQSVVAEDVTAVAAPSGLDPVDDDEVRPAAPAPTPAELVQDPVAPVSEPLTVIPAGDTPLLPPLSPPVEPVEAAVDEDDIAVR